MLFSSLTFLFVFLPAILVCYYVAPRLARNAILLLFSYLFYAWGGVSYSAVLIISVVANFLFVKQIGSKKATKKRWLTAGIIFNLVILGLFKYLDFIIANINGLSQLVAHDAAHIESLGIALPLGISFFTFQQMSMLWDVYRSDREEASSFANTALYISFFPQLVAGPIVRYHDIIDQIKDRVESFELFKSGLRKFIVGLFKKIVIANTCASIADTVMVLEIDAVSTPLAWLGIVAYAFQIYFDFSGYSDMAIGLGRMFGFRIPENFDFPYIATSIKDFWRRWHISLSTWFRDYLYIPLGGNRKGAVRTYVNLFIVFFLTGLWHGATWSFVFWGLFHGSFLVLERLGFERILQKIPRPISWIYTMLIVLVGWVFFRIEAFPDALAYVGKMFGMGTEGELHFEHYLDRERIVVLILAVISSSPVFMWLKGVIGWDEMAEIKPMNRFGKLLDEFGNPSSNQSIQKMRQAPFQVMMDVVYIGMFMYAVMIINSGSYNPFIYFRF